MKGLIGASVVAIFLLLLTCVCSTIVVCICYKCGRGRRDVVFSATESAIQNNYCCDFSHTEIVQRTAIEGDDDDDIEPGITDGFTRSTAQKYVHGVETSIKYGLGNDLIKYHLLSNDKELRDQLVDLFVKRKWVVKIVEEEEEQVDNTTATCRVSSNGEPPGMFCFSNHSPPDETQASINNNY